MGLIEETIGYLDLNGKMFKHKEVAIESSIRSLIMSDIISEEDAFFSISQVRKNRKKIIELLEMLNEDI